MIERRSGNDEMQEIKVTVSIKTLYTRSDETAGIESDIRCGDIPDTNTANLKNCTMVITER